MKKKFLAVVLALVVATGIGWSAGAPAHAQTGNSVVNLSIGWVQVVLDNGRYVSLAGYGAKVSNVSWVVIGRNSCVSIGTKRYCATYQGYEVKLGLAQYSVRRIS